ncbi:hypothetical protein D3C79_1061110 [compost metagenome]
MLRPRLMRQRLALVGHGRSGVALALGNRRAQGEVIGAVVGDLAPMQLGPIHVVGIEGTAGRGEPSVVCPLAIAEAVPDRLCRL